MSLFKGIVNRRGFVGLLATALAFTLTIGSPVALAKELTMISDGNVRKDASTSSDKVAKASSGSTFTIEGETTGSDGNTWYQITVDGKAGYVRSDLVKVEEGGDEAAASTVLSSSASSITPRANDTNVRSGPSTGESVVTKVSTGSEYAVLGETRDSDGNLWYQIEVDGKQGYLREDTVDVVQQTQPENTEEPEQVEQPAENTTTISSVVSSRVLPEGADLENMTIDLNTLKSWESGNYYVLYTKKTDDSSDSGEWYLYSIENNQFQRIATLDASEEDQANTAKKKGAGFKIDKKIIIILIAVLLIVVVIVVVILIVRRRSSGGGYEEMDTYDDDDDDDDDDDYRVPAKRGARSPARREAAPRNFMSRRDHDPYEDEDDDDEDMDDDDMYSAPRKGRRIMAPERNEAPRGGDRRRQAPRSSQRRYRDEDMEDTYDEDDDFEFDFLNDKR